MTKRGAWKMACIGFLLHAAMVITAPGQTFTTLGSFDGTDGANPSLMSFIQADDGNLYGTTLGGGSSVCSGGCGTVFAITQGHMLKRLYTFCTQAPCSDGSFPLAGLIQGTDGNFYGTTDAGGASNNGTVFRITHAGALTTLYSFCAQPNCADGANPQGSLVQASDGNLYGTTSYGGNTVCSPRPGGCGTVFRITRQGALTTLHSFGESDGYNPVAGLVQATDGNLYGTTQLGGTGTPEWGTVFKITLNGRLTTLYSFCTPTNCVAGGQPFAALVQGTDGNFYGTSAAGGSQGQGTVFRISPPHLLTTLYSFGLTTDGGAPYAGLVQGTDGLWYGTTTGEGTGGYGTLFQMTPAGTLTTLYYFCTQPRCADGSSPFGGLLQDTNGIFYGTTRSGGRFDDNGTAFSLDMGLGPFVSFVRAAARVGGTGGILGQGFTGTTNVSLNGISASFTVVSDTFIRSTVPAGATTGYVTVTTPSGTLTSNVPFQVIP
jgi:uncharacterized repeat protein (TIGR03803 family)